jgi:hypothetical protein
MHLIDKIILAIDEEDRDGIARSIRDLRKAQRLSVEAFAIAIGASAKSVRRWEAKKTTNIAPRRSRVLLWNSVFGHNRNRLAGQQAASYGSARTSRGRTLGIFGDSYVFDCLRNAEEVWALKSRMEFHAGHNAEALKVFISQMENHKEFRLNCIWVKPKDLATGAKAPVNHEGMARASYVTMFRYLASNVQGSKAKLSPSELHARVAKRIRGYELPLNLAATMGLADAPVSSLVVILRQEVDPRIGKLLMFTEAPVAERDEDGVLISNSNDVSSSWAQLHPRIASGFWNDVYKRFDCLKAITPYEIPNEELVRKSPLEAG